MSMHGKQTSAKHVPFESAPALFAKLRGKGKRIVQCHGTFDLIHPGHIIHFEEAKSLGDILVVTVTAEQQVNKGPGRPYFNDLMRIKSLSALECVDYVVIVPYPAAVEAIECVRPHIYCKGKEYENFAHDVTGNIKDDVATVEQIGGRIAYVGSVVFSSTRLLNRHFDAYPAAVKRYCMDIAANCSPEAFNALVDGFASLKVLVVGDIIFDRYSTVSVQGLTSKNLIVSSRFVREELQAGGALAVLRHLRQFTANVKILSLVGNEPWINKTLKQYVTPSEDEIVRSDHFTSIIKQRFVNPLSAGKELIKLFAVNYIDAQQPSAETLSPLISKLRKIIKGFDLVMVMDFGHGLLNDEMRAIAQDKSHFLALNCQTNSNNYGFNIIKNKYRRTDSFSLDQTELVLACGRKEIDYQEELEHLRDHLDARYAWLTRGAIETIGLKTGDAPCLCPPFENNVVDTVGAGDAFCSVASMAAARGLSANLSTFLGQLAGAQAVKIVGNSAPISKSVLLKAGMTMLNY